MQRRAEIDWLKGFAIVCVLLIHAEPLVGTTVHELLINRAVPIFIVLFGVTSEYWWQGRGHQSFAATARLWYRSRALRLMVPVWGMLAVWWAVTLAFGPKNLRSPIVALATAVGYMPWVGTGWFVTLIIQLVVLFPLLELCVVRLGRPACLALSLVVLVLSHLYSLEVIDFMRWLLRDSAPVVGFFTFYYFWIFAPAKLLPVVAGMAIAHRRRPLALPDAALCALVFATGIAFRDTLSNPHAKAAVQSAMDVPLTILLLVVIRGVRVVRPIADLLAWCGVSSWGLYLGQLLVHTSCRVFGFQPEAAALPVRWAYFVCLFVGAVGLVTIGEAVRNVPARAWLSRFGAHQTTR